MKPKSEIETETEIKSGIEIETESESETESEIESGQVVIPVGEDLLDVGKVQELVRRIVDAAQELGCNLLETRTASKAVYASSSALISKKMEASAGKGAATD